MQIFIYLAIISFLVRTIRNILFLTFLWQLKEYRLDRMLAHLKTEQGKKLILGPITSVKWILFIGILIGGIFYSYYILWFIWILEAIFNIRELALFRWRVPRFTLKVTLILLAVLFTISNFLLKDITDIGVAILIDGIYVDRFIGLIMAIIIGILNLPVNFYKKSIIWKAKNKLDKYKKLTVIGITGSYGKTSTKEFLYQILSRKYNVLKTEGSVNTEIGVAQTILKNLNQEHEIFIVEMGAYKKGEIEAICRMVKPHIGIITGINEQHLELFGSLEKTLTTKFELIKNLEMKGVAIFNEDNQLVKKMIGWTKKKRQDLTIVGYSLHKRQELYVENIRMEQNIIVFYLNFDGRKEEINLKLSGRQNIYNFLAAVVVALKLGFTLPEIKKISSSILPAPKTMKSIVGPKGVTFINDTFNTNPDGVIAALEYMILFKGKKILVLTPLIELGKESERIHKILGKKAAQVCDLILLTNLNYNQSLIEGVMQVGSREKVQLVNTCVAINLIMQNIDREGVVVFEGREAGKILEKLLIIN